MGTHKTARTYSLSGNFYSVAREAELPRFIEKLAESFRLSCNITTEKHFFYKEDIGFELSGRLRDVLQAKQILVSSLQRYNQQQAINRLEKI